MSVTKLPAPAWRDRLQLSANGTPRANIYNTAIAVRALVRNFYLDEFRAAIVADGPVPWNDACEWRSWSDSDSVKLAEYLQGLDLQVGLDVVDHAVRAVSYERRKHPLRDWLSELRWDGRPRIDTWLTKYLSAQKTDYTKAVGACWLISAVARVMIPGCQADHMLILEGPEGLKKSSAFRALAGQDYFSDEVAAIGTKDCAMQLAGRWIVEMSELSAIRKSDMWSIASFLTRRTDIYRPPYGRYVITQPRQCVFSGTVNPPFSLPEEDGARRFWFVPILSCDTDSLEQDREQLWAEAVSRFNSGAIWFLDDAEIKALAKEQQEVRKVRDEWAVPVADHIENMNFVTVAQILEYAFKIEVGKWTQAEMQRVGRIMTRLGWESKIMRLHGAPSKVYRNPECVKGWEHAEEELP